MRVSVFMALLITSEAAQAAPQGSSLDTLRTALGAEIQYQPSPLPVVRYCPDNTCEAFRTSRRDAGGMLCDFALLYLWYLSQYNYLGDWQSSAPPKRVDALVQHYSGSCGAVTAKGRARCALVQLQAMAQVRVVFIRYDEGGQAEVATNLAQEFERLK